jgi:single-strand DNA-binding protein
MASFNKVILIGNLTKDPELRYTAGGAPVANLRLAVNRTWLGKDGQKKEDVCYVTVVVWNKLAETVGEFKKKGDPIFVEGRLQSKSWETEDKQKRTVLEVIADRVQFLNRGAKTGGSDAPHEGAMEDEGVPQGPPSSGSEEDIPF